ncbi:MAG TPA: hypothetical protein VMF51_23395 [Nocardioides sp.]|uniref:hypothetical protein n=1 Tax=Nocardioides sp. TaxID=35761 RepID=UPI002BBC618A|nr:hypothetical protein [Nocardioides sp.]HTW18091.1 hypothetical protein [Nocardioides sp.]
MDKSEFATLETSVAAAAQHACQALLAMESLRHSADPQHQTAYHCVHDLIGDLGSLLLQLDLMARESEPTPPAWQPAPPPPCKTGPARAKRRGVSS